MELKSYLSPMGQTERDAFAAAVGTSRGHLQNVMSGFRTCAPALSMAVEVQSRREVMRWETRPDDWHRIWPDLIGTNGAPEIGAPVSGFGTALQE